MIILDLFVFVCRVLFLPFYTLWVLYDEERKGRLLYLAFEKNSFVHNGTRYNRDYYEVVDGELREKRQ